MDNTITLDIWEDHEDDYPWTITGSFGGYMDNNHALADLHIRSLGRNDVMADSESCQFFCYAASQEAVWAVTEALRTFIPMLFAPEVRFTKKSR